MLLQQVQGFSPVARITLQPISSNMLAITSRTAGSSSTKRTVCVIENQRSERIARSRSGQTVTRGSWNFVVVPEL